ncbi:Domain of unknown function DUF1833 [uncultured Caudovirales phage]|uniref:DUF1833 domain-containing protein n=1 Tax=uncultured Caudovirales phage TaxID=2100421 RepID=A0A6J5KRG1_9CAUD|nr:Domain of unknown function DUF1833 [uncultured Caudovirales phage]
MRTLSTNAIRSINSQQTDEVWLILLTITHADLPTPIRVVNNNENVTSRSNVFQAFPFEIILPGQDPDSPPKAMIRMDNVDRTVVSLIRNISSAPTVLMEVILASQPDTVEISFGSLSLRAVTYDASTIEGELFFEALYNEPITLSMTPSRFPGLF